MDMPESTTEFQADTPRRIRWWPAGLILAVATGAWVAIWQFEGLDRQVQNLQTTQVILATLGALLLWVLLASRLRWKSRLLVCVGVVGLVGLLAATLEIRGVTGDLFPVVEWRWTKSTSQSLSASQATVESARLPELSDRSIAYPQFCGPDRNSRLSGIRLTQDWKAQPPELLWRQPIGPAWSGFAIVGQYAVTMEQRGESEMVTCYHLLTGDLLWSHSEDAHFMTVIAGEGPRSVPTIVGERVFTLGASGVLNCLSLADGSPIWSRNIVEENEASVPGWGLSCSPLVVEDKVIVSAGGGEGRSLVAYDAESGEPIWSGGDDSNGYSSPMLATIDGVRQVLIFNDPGVKSHDFESGEVLWGYDWHGKAARITMPVAISDGRVLISTGYGTRSELIEASLDSSGSWSATQIWESKRLKSKFANIIVQDGSIYGLDDGIFVCLDLATGERLWKRGRYGHGQMILVDDLLLVMAENGEIVLLDPNPEELRELTRFAVLDGKTWNPPALAGEYLLVRNDKEAACYRMPVEP